MWLSSHPYSGVVEGVELHTTQTRKEELGKVGETGTGEMLPGPGDSLILVIGEPGSYSLSWWGVTSAILGVGSGRLYCSVGLAEILSPSPSLY